MRYDPADYLYASARVRAMEGRLIGREKQASLPDMSEAELAGAIARGELPACEDESALADAQDAVARSLPDPALIRFLQYPYDCHNLKVLEKCRVKGEDPTPLLSMLGSVPREQLLSPPDGGLSALLPPHLAAAVDEARDAYSKTGDPRGIDLILDRAAFVDMKEAAGDVPFAAAWVERRADLLNLMLCLRSLLMGGELGRTLLRSALLPVGSFDEAALLALYDGGEAFFYDEVSKTPFAKVFLKGERLAVTEKRADDFLMELVRGARSVTYGAEVPLAYLLALETQCKNLRILLSGKRMGLDRDTILSRMRDFYV